MIDWLVDSPFNWLTDRFLPLCLCPCVCVAFACVSSGPAVGPWNPSISPLSAACTNIHIIPQDPCQMTVHDRSRTDRLTDWLTNICSMPDRRSNSSNTDRQSYWESITLNARRECEEQIGGGGFFLTFNDIGGKIFDQSIPACTFSSSFFSFFFYLFCRDQLVHTKSAHKARISPQPADCGRALPAELCVNSFPW